MLVLYHSVLGVKQQCSIHVTFKQRACHAQSPRMLIIHDRTQLLVIPQQHNLQNEYIRLCDKELKTLTEGSE